MINLVNVKNILRIILSVLIIFSMLKSCANAWTYDQFIDYMEQISTSQDASQTQKNRAILIYNNSERLRSYLSSYTSIVCDTNYGFVQIFATSNSINNSTVNGYGTLQFNNMSWRDITMDSSGAYKIVDHGNTSKNYLTNTNMGLIEIPQTTEMNLPSSYWLQNRYLQGMEFTPISTTPVAVGAYTNVQAKKLNAIDGGSVLGKITKWNDSYDYYYFQLRDANNNVVAWLKYKRGDTSYYRENMDFVIDTYTITIPRRIIYFNSIYTLSIYASETEINEDFSIAKDSVVYTYIFLPSNAEISNGVITNYGSGDNYSSQDSTNDIINNINDSSEVTNILESYFPLFGSGNASGELSNIASEFGFTPLDNPFTTFLLHILESSYDALTLREPVVLTADYKTMHFVLSSEQFRTPDSNLKNFIRNCMIFLYLYGNYVFFHYLITLAETARIDKAVAVLGTDEFYDSDIL